MFETLKSKLADVFDGLARRGALSESDVDAALREVRLALLDADVALPAVKAFTEKVREQAVGVASMRAVRPDQQVVKIVHDALVEMLGGDAEKLNIATNPPSVILMAGLQGSGKTTTAGKLALRLKSRERKKVLVASLDMTRPAARKQLRLLGEQAEVGILPEADAETPVQIAKRALQVAKLQAYDVLILDTAGRLSIDEALMAELREIKKITNSHEVLLVADAMTGQDAANTAKAFNDALPLTGVVLTKADGDARGGAALSVRHITGKPIKFIGMGEKTDALEPFYPDRIASRILGMGDVLSLVEEAERKLDKDKADKLAKKLKKGKGFDLEDLLEQFQQMKKLGGMAGMLDKLPGMGGMAQMAQQGGVADKELSRMEAIIYSMTPHERRFPDVINGSRKKRIAAGSGTQIPDINRVLKQHKQMQKMMKKMSGKGGMKNMMRGMKGMMGGGGFPGGGGGMPPFKM